MGLSDQVLGAMGGQTGDPVPGQVSARSALLLRG
jgi:hypothetical protein